MRRGTHSPGRKGGERKDHAARTHLYAHLPREPALRPGLALSLQRLREKGIVKFIPGAAPAPFPAPHHLGALTLYLA